MARAPVSKFGLGHPAKFYRVPLNQIVSGLTGAHNCVPVPAPFHRVPPSWVAKW